MFLFVCFLQRKLREHIHIEITTKIPKETDLVFSDGLYQGTVDNVDDNAEKQDDGILGHSSAERIPTGLIVQCVCGR